MRTILSLSDFENEPHTIRYDFIDARQQKMRMYYDGVPYLLQHGIHCYPDKEHPMSSIGVWRYGKKFNIELKSSDIRNTELYEKCQALWKNDWKGHKMDENARMAHKQAWNDHRAELFDLMIRICLPTLIALAPVQEYWKTLGAVLHCPNYALKIVGDPDTDHPRVEQATAITEDIDVNIAYAAKPTKLLGEIPTGIPKYSPYDILVDDSFMTGECVFHESPHRVQLKDGKMCYFISGQGESDWFEEAEIRDESLNTIRAYFEIEKATKHGRKYPPGLPKMVGVVIDNEIVDSSPGQDSGTFVAGILIAWIVGAKRLSAINSISDPTIDQREKWKQQVLNTITTLHEQGIAIGAEDICHADDPYSYVNDHTILVDPQQDAFLTLEDPVFALRSYDGQSYAKYAKLDLDALEKVFLGCGEESPRYARL